MTTIKTPSILAFEKKLVPSDARFYGTAWGEASQADPTALHLVEKSVRGTLSNRKPKGKLEGANLQRVDSCSLLQGQDTLKVVFTLKILSGFQIPAPATTMSSRRLFSIKSTITLPELPAVN